jgi:hypothetical protein
VIFFCIHIPPIVRVSDAPAELPGDPTTLVGEDPVLRGQQRYLLHR